MELHFMSTPCECLRKVLGEVRNLEQAQEIRLTDGMPDIGRVLCGWGQILQRSKEWNGDSVSLTAGMMVWVLYAPEDGTEPRWVESWIPFSMQWDLPESLPEGTLRFSCLTRFVDARSMSARKLMVRAGIGTLAEAWVPHEVQIRGPEQEPEGVELKKVRYPVKIPVEAGEKVFSLEESLTLPSTMPPMEKAVCYTLEPEIQEQRVVGDKTVFRGVADLHLLYEGSDAKLHSWDFQIPFHQFAELRKTRSPEAEAVVRCGVTALEAEQNGETGMTLKAGLTGQYLIEDQEILELVEDAYCPGRELTVQRQELELDRILESRRETIAAENSIPGEGDQIADVTFCPDFPRQRPGEDRITMELGGSFQILSYDASGELQASVTRWEGQLILPADQQTEVTAMPLSPAEPQILMGSGDMKVRTEFPLQLTVEAGEGMSMVTDLEIGEGKDPDPDRPSLILRRTAGQELWDLAKESGSTVQAIQQANHLETEPVPGQMLLIPIL